ncbi:hypothetical protein C8R43DRAFT_1111800 [Mycena crocata]|nr:hypothetical protein C8R43DRAFT_1111800 [Mycena crocata]
MSSPFAFRLGTNYCPTDEATGIRSLLIDPQGRLDTLHKKIADMQRAIDKLAQERDSIAGYVDAHKALLFPIRRVPLDIIQEIFTACIPSHRNCAMVASEAPVLLGRICSSWRSVSLSTPRLWSRLHIVDPSRPFWGNAAVQLMYEGKRRQRLETTKMWLGRSGQRPLSISFLEGTEYGTSSADFIQALLPLASRWENINLAIRGSELKALSHLGKADVPMLKSLLIHLSVTDNSVLSSEAALQILSRCPLLETLQLLTEDDGPDNSTGHPILTHNSIHTLDCTCCGRGSDSTRFLGHLPKLRVFKFRAVEGPTAASTFLVTCPSLESLDINVKALDKGSRAQLFDGTCLYRQSTVTKLHLSDSEDHDVDDGAAESNFVDEEILNLLTPSSELPSPCCPALEEFSVSNCRMFTDRSILRFITARMTLVQPLTLKRVICNFKREMEVDIMPDLQPSVVAGISVELSYPAPILGNFSPWKGLEGFNPAAEPFPNGHLELAALLCFVLVTELHVALPCKL